MASAVQANGGASAPLNVIVEEDRAKLVQESFHSILDVLRQLGLHRESPKLFIMYAHENESSKYKAHQEIVKNYIAWFKKLLFNVDSDKSPHGYDLFHESVHQTASVNIVSNQICLLPTGWHKQNVDYVLVFYSKLLASYLKDERDFFEHCDETYSEAITSVCKKYEDKHQVPVEDVCKEIRTTQEKYAEVMGSRFHHVLTETALLSFRNRGRGIDYTIPIILSGEEDWEHELKWEPNFVHTTKTQIQITVKPEEEGQKFFKILLMLESLEIHRQEIEVMAKSFDECVELSKQDLHPMEYRKQVEIRIIGAMQSLHDHSQTVGKPTTPGRIRDFLNVYSKLDVESLQRVSGEKLPKNLSEIDLAVFESLSPGDEDPAEGQREGRQIVPMYGLFDERKLEKEYIKPLRILISGRPGIGKTTLCRRIMYEYSWNEDLRKKFDLIVRIPVRRLEYSADLNNLLFEEYFEAVSQGRDLSNKLASLILDREVSILENKNANSVNILIILDGLDEARRWSHERRALLEKLMQRPAVIITSRSHATGMLNVSFDLHLEALGLSTMNVDAYLNNTNIVPSDKAIEILQFIERKAFLKDMVRVPIHLDILCYSWGELHLQNATTESTIDKGEDVLPTITALYQAVVRSLWRKDIPVLGKVDYGELVTVEVIDAVRDSVRLERLVEAESRFLEEIANRLMETDRLECTGKDITEAVQRLESQGDQLPLSLERNLNRISLLRSYFSERHRKYCFVHLTFQEFFAARYLARCLARDGASFETLLRKYKYNRRYEVVWMFFTGMLSNVEQLDYFFNLLDDEPRDLVGIQHVHLIMYCLSECHTRIRPSNWNEYQRRLEEWLRVEDWFRFQFQVPKAQAPKAKFGSIGSSMAFPEKILRKQLSPNAKSIPAHLMLVISRRGSLSAKFSQNINQIVNDMSVSPEGIHAIGTLAERANLSGTTISFFLMQMQCETELQNGAFRILQCQRHLPNSVIQHLVEWLKDPRLCYRANRILGIQAVLPKETTDHAIETLMDQISSGSSDYWNILGGRSVCLRQDLHAKAIAKIWNILEQMASRNVSVPDDILSKISRTHPIPPDHVERLVESLEIRLDTIITGFKLFAAKILGQEPSLQTNILKIIVELLGDEVADVRREALRILQRQPCMPPYIIDMVRDLVKKNKIKLGSLLSDSTHLGSEVCGWLMTQITKSTIRYHEAVDFVLGQSDLPDYVVKSLLPEFLLDRPGQAVVLFNQVAYSLYGWESPSTEVVNLILELIPSETCLTRAPPAINQDAFAVPLTKALEEAKSKTKAYNTALLLKMHKNIDQESVKRLRVLLSTKPLTELAASKSSLALDCLLRQVKLDPDIILDLHNNILLGTSEAETAFRMNLLWKDRHIENWCANLALWDDDLIYSFLKDFLKRPVEGLAPAYIDGKTIYYYAADGTLTEQRLEDEGAFRKRFREAQRRAHVPEWAWMKLPKAETKKLSENISGELLVRRKSLSGHRPRNQREKRSRI